MKKYLVLAKKGCPFCEKAIKFLKDHKVKLNIKYVGDDFTNQEFKQKYQSSPTYPKVIVFEKKKGEKKWKESETIMTSDELIDKHTE